MGLFKPAWMSDDIAKREAAFGRLNDFTLSEIVCNQSLAADIRMHAVRFIKEDITRFSCIRKNTQNTPLIASIIESSKNIGEAINTISIATKLDGVINMQELIKLINRQDFLYQIAIDSRYKEFSAEAITRLDKTHLQLMIDSIDSKVEAAIEYAQNHSHRLWRLDNSTETLNRSLAYKALGDMVASSGDTSLSQRLYAFGGNIDAIKSFEFDEVALLKIASIKQMSMDARLTAICRLYPDMPAEDTRTILFGEPITREDETKSGFALREQSAKHIMDLAKAHPEWFVPVWDELYDMIAGERKLVKSFERFGDHDSSHVYYELHGCGLDFPEKPSGF